MAANDLTTLAYVQAYMQNPSAGVSLLLPQLITAASQFIESYTSRQFLNGSFSRLFNGTGNGRLILWPQPVSAVSSVSINGRPVPAAPLATFSAPGYLVDQYGLTLRGCQTFCRGAFNVAVQFTAGYGANPADMPADIQQCVAEMVNIRSKRIAQADKTSLGIEQQTTAFVASELTPSVKAVLSNYKPPMIPAWAPGP